MSDHGPYPTIDKMVHQIDRLPNHLSLYRWMAVQIDIAEDLDNDAEWQQFVMDFIAWAVGVFNRSQEESDPVTLDDAYSAIREIWKQDAQEAARMRLAPR